jgi:hypothetical protein
MQPFTLFVRYVNSLTGEWRMVPPILTHASSAEEASRTAIAVANFAYSEVSKEILIRVVGDDNGRPIAEIRRPISN